MLLPDARLYQLGGITGLGWTVSLLRSLGAIVGDGNSLITRLVAEPQSLLYVGGCSVPDDVRAGSTPEFGFKKSVVSSSYRLQRCRRFGVLGWCSARTTQQSVERTAASRNAGTKVTGAFPETYE